MTIESKQVTIPASDGFSLAGSVFEPGGGAQAASVVLINSAMAVKRGYYERYAQFLASRGLPAVTFDYRGIGNSRSNALKGMQASLRDWGEKDIDGAIAWVERTYPGARLLVVGHSAGGWLLSLTRRNRQVKAMLAVAVQSGYWGMWDRPRRYLMAALWYGLMPGLTQLLSYFPAKALKLGEDLPAGVAREWARWGRHAQYMVDDSGVPLREHFRGFSAPILSYSFEDDQMAPKRAVDELMSYYTAAALVRKHLRPGDLGVKAIGHFGFFRERFQGNLWQETTDWLLKQ